MSSKGLELYTLHKKFLLPPGTLIGTLRNLERANLIAYHDETVQLSLTGHKFVSSNPDLFLRRSNNTLKVKDAFKGPMIDADQPYAPIVSNMDTNFFRRK